MKIKMRRIVTVLVLAFAMTACGGSGGSKGEADNRSSYEKLVQMPQDLEKAIKAVLSPIESVDTIVEQMAALPEKTKLEKDALSKLMSSAFAGEAFSAPEGMEEGAAKELETFLTTLSEFKTNLINAPENALELVKNLPGMLVETTALYGKVAAESLIVKNNPFASKADKKKAADEEKGADKAKDDTIAALEGAKESVTGLPVRATAAVAKFTAALGDFGITDAAMQTVKDAEGEAKDAVK